MDGEAVKNEETLKEETLKEETSKEQTKEPEDKAKDSTEETKEPEPKAEQETIETKDKEKQETKEHKEVPVVTEKPKEKEQSKESIKEDGISAADYKKLVDDYSDTKSKAEKLEGAVKTILDNKLAAIPDEFKDIVPDVDDLAKLAWLEKAESKGLFTKKENPEIEIGGKLKVDPPVTKSQEKLTPQQRLANYFSTAYKK